MKIAIPTNDGLHIADDEFSAKGFHVFSVELGEIIDEELRWNMINEIGSIENKTFDTINDCSVILVKNSIVISERDAGGMIRIPVDETIITKIIWHYLSEVLMHEANTCCCP